MAIHWKDIVAEKRTRQAAAIPKAWLITPPPADVLDVTTFPDTCGLLTPKEVEITNTIDVAVLLAKMASSEWSAVEVTTAFYKRAIVAQQVVSIRLRSYRSCGSLTEVRDLDQLLDRDLRRACIGSRC